MKDSFCFVFNQIAGSFWGNLEKLMSEIGLHAGQVFLLSALWENDGQSQAELVRNLQVTPPTVYNMIIRMEKSGLVETRKNPRDARQILIFLTPKGLDIKPEVEKQWAKLEEQTLSGLSETEKMILYLLLKKLKTV